MAKNKEASAVTYKAAFASTDGESVNIHYGRAEKFFVYAIKDDEGYDFLEERKAKAVCMDGKHTNKGEAVSECAKILSKDHLRRSTH